MSTQTNENGKEPVQKEAEDSASMNFERLRKKVESLERSKQASDEKAAALEKQIAESAKRKAKDADPADEDHYDEPYVDERRLNKKLGRMKEDISRDVDERAEAKARSIMAQEKNAMFVKQNPDFEAVLSADVIQKFATKHPEIAENLLEMPDGFSRQKLLYESIKLSGVHKPAEPKQSIQDTIDSRRKGPYYQPSGMGSPAYGGVGVGKEYSETDMKTAYDHVQALKSRLRL